MSDPAPHAPFVAPSIADLAPLFPGYDFEGLIATGGMGAVYRAVQRSLDRTVAIKVLPVEFSRDEVFCRNFEAEAKAMAKLNHPNLIGVYDFGEADGMLFIVMEYVPGRSLHDASHGKALAPAEAARMVAAICDGLAHAHENGILHRDIKPSNILLDQNARPKIGDFGLARPIETQVEEGEEIFGTPHYTAPEVVQNPLQVDSRADIFSVGVMLHELLTGKLPASDERPASVIARCDPRFDAIVRRATQSLPELRQASAAEIAHDLRAIASGNGTRGAPAGPRKVGPVPSGPVPPRRQAPRATAASSGSSSGTWLLVALAAAACLAAYLFLGPAPTPPQPPAPPPSAHPEQAPPKNERRPGQRGEFPAPQPEEAEDRDPNTAAPPQPVENLGSRSKPGATEAPAPSPNGRPASKADVPALLAKAQGVLRERAAPAVAQREQQLAANLKAFDREFSRLIRRLEPRDVRERAEGMFEDLLDRSRANGNRIGELPADSLRFLPPDMKKVLAEYQTNETGIDDTLDAALKTLGSTYEAGLERQIQRFRSEQDPGAAALLEEELETTRRSSDHFPDLMLEPGA